MVNMVEKTNGQMKLGEYSPIPETKNKAFQEDSHGNFRITVNGKFSEWKRHNEIAILNMEGQTYIGVTDFYNGDLPKGCALRVEVVDEEGDANFYKFKIIDLVEDVVLDSDDVEDILLEPLFEGDEYAFNVKQSKMKDFVKIMIIEFDMTKEDVEEYLRNALPAEDYDIINEDGEKINTR